ncbi:MAG: hypothetical protein JWN38_568 [Candidatus Saccharibacteria bacterium]|nr:hypothetical protein [Candidatus Saccharibacteria bacterium]
MDSNPSTQQPTDDPDFTPAGGPPPAEDMMTPEPQVITPSAPAADPVPSDTPAETTEPTVSSPEPAAPAPVVGTDVTPPSAPAADASQPEPAHGPVFPAEPAAPVVTVGNPSPEVAAAAAGLPAAAAAGNGVNRSVKPPFFKRKLVIGSLAVILILLIGGGAFYFGYWTRPSVVYSKSLSKTGAGLTSLADEFTQLGSDKTTQGYTGSGSYKVSGSSFKTDGKLSLKSGGNNAEVTVDVGLGTTRVSLDTRAISDGKSTPDLYLKASGISGLGALLGSDEASKAIDGLDGKWIAVDHTLIDNLAGTVTATSAATSLPTAAQIDDELNRASQVNEDYLFSTDPSTGVTKVTKTIGKETVDGHKTYHYEAVFVKANVKKYITAQRNALKASKLNDWITKNNYQSSVDDAYNSLLKDADQINTNYKFQVWSDINEHYVYKVRFPDTANKATSYAEVGLDYHGGSQYPFFIGGKDETGDFRLGLTLDDKQTSAALNFKSTTGTGSNATTIQADFTLKPSTTKISVDKPTDTTPLMSILEQLGLSQYLSVGDGIQTKASDTKRQTDIGAIQSKLEAYYAEHGYYPGLADINSASWRKSNGFDIDSSALQDPDGTTPTLAAAPAAKVYAYSAKNAAGAACTAASMDCEAYTLTATLSDGTAFTKQSLN